MADNVVPFVIESERETDPLEVVIGDMLRFQLASLGVTHQKAGDAVGVTFQQIGKHLTGINRLSVSRLVRLARGVGFSATQFVAQLEALPNFTVAAESRTPAKNDRSAKLLANFEKLNRNQKRAVMDLIQALAREHE